MTTATIAAWLLTYLLHSTIILGVALTVSRIMDGRGLALQESLLRTALIGGIVTATLQLGLGITPAAGVFSLEPAVQQPLAATSGVPFASAVEVSKVATPGTPHDILSAWAMPFVVFWGIASFIGLTAIVRSMLDLRRLLRTRCFRPAGRLVERLATAMGLRQRVRISTSKAIAVPFATGIGRPEICCPERVSELAHEHQTGLFAHEMAHLARRDPAWQLVYRLGEAVLVLQPLNRFVRRRLEELAEHLTDERAVACTGDRLGLARCLVVVAHWGHSNRIGLPATALAAGPRLNRRVRRLISGTTERAFNTRWTAAAGVALTIGSVLILPAIATRPVHAESESTTAIETTTWSTIDERPTAPPPAEAPPNERPPAPQMIEPPSRVNAPSLPKAAPAPEAQPSPASAPGVPWTVPSPETPPSQAPPAPTTSPAPAAEPVPSTVPAPTTPPARRRTSETERRREEVRQLASERARVERRSVEVERVRAEAQAREHYRVSRIQAERARESAREAARQSRLTEAQREELRLQALNLGAEARRLAREEMQAERESTRNQLAEARTRALERAITFEKLSEEQREAYERQAAEMAAQREFQIQRSLEAAQERAQELAEQARALAEKAEAERRERENESK